MSDAVESLIKTKSIEIPGLGKTSICELAVFEEKISSLVEGLGVPVGITPVHQGVLLTFTGIEGDESRLIVKSYDAEKLIEMLDAEVLRAPSLR